MTEIIELDIERAVAGGFMLARHGGRVVFVSGAIPGERVRARITKSSRHSLWAETVELLEASADRREVAHDPACGGLALAHIRYDRQLALKGQILADAFRRLARLQVEPPAVLGSPETEYRLRSRLHVRDGKVGFFREGTHELCDASPSRQLRADALDAARSAVEAIGARAADCNAIVVSENVASTECVLHLEPHDGATLADAVPVLPLVPGATGITTMRRERLMTLAGNDTVTDTAAALFGPADSTSSARWTRRPTSFFQGNRFLTGALIHRVLSLAPGKHVADLYAGVGLFTVPLAERGARVLAVEGDRSSAEDLAGNVQAYGSQVRVQRTAVEDLLARAPQPAPDVAIVDPPRTGMSADALDRLAAWGLSRVIYVSCDPPTLARDAARLATHGFRLLSVEGLDLFPNTPHVEAIAAFVRP